MILAVLLVCAPVRIAITEVMANPKGVSGAHRPEDRNEFVELFNYGAEPVDLFDWTIDDGDAVDRIRAWTDSSLLEDNASLRINQTWLEPGRYAVVLDPEYTDTAATNGFIRPYCFPDSTLILTVGNTSIGNGLAANDPLTLVASSAYGFADTATFGTPFNRGDTFPTDAGDGVSWERVRPERPDTKANWSRCRDTSGATPGRENSVAVLTDLAVARLGVSAGNSGMVAVETGVRNCGFRTVGEWRFSLWLDLNNNFRRDRNEGLVDVAGMPLEPDAETLFVASFTSPRTRADLWAELTCAEDRETLNNRSRVSVGPAGGSRLLELLLASFSPDGDGSEDSLPVAFQLSEPGGRLRIAVFDLAGREVRELYSGRAETADGLVTWDGRSSSGRALGSGIYCVWLEYRVRGSTVTDRQAAVLIRR
ncbi:MAG: lamin tail domain-containing protein [candidate division WOR-3 bacterium]